MVIVKKFGGSSVKDKDRLAAVASIIEKDYKKKHNIVVVVSAQGDTTDELIDKAYEVNKNPSKREMDMLVSAGEQMSASLLAMALDEINIPSISLLGWQAGFSTSSAYQSARIKNINTERIERELDSHKVVIVAGFQGLNKYDDITTLGRGGSDTSAVALAASLKADLCQIYTDVTGVFTSDPRYVKGAKKLDRISYDEMLELASLGAGVLNNRSVEMAKKYNVELEVLSSYKDENGTIVTEEGNVEKMLISGVARDDDTARISILAVADKPGLAFKIFSKLASKNINVDVILQSVGRDNTKDISFTVPMSQFDDALEVSRDYANKVGAADVVFDKDVSKVSIVGAGMETHPGVAASMFECLFDKDINIQMISTSEIKISVLIAQEDAPVAVQAIHNKFFDEED